LFYVAIVLFGHRSLSWGVGRFVVAETVANFPGGAFVFELWESHRRKRKQK
jgi:hypothetical protein